MSRFNFDSTMRSVERELEKERRAERAKAKAARTREHPLRKVVRVEGLWQVLSCGHRVRPRSDMLREYTDAKSRRCEFCTKVAHPERYCLQEDCLSGPSAFPAPGYEGLCVHHGKSKWEVPR